ncbi:2OG-Fe(II) oxygenase [Marilutibacter chinensis]|uniref:2OG-Fe(II) oxygenase n=1 Tax=Marilutibacter chinensis TaxID=2912247 RepID=A0ABS9HQH3_9GAMM|nr:2OG-Fe(II) oxygenase [Lysobacter chinensis]MCF7220766.1 2OG-Fe(II) oxygenase [Lysobacter chinensis]
MNEHAGPSSATPRPVTAEVRARAESCFRQAQADVAAQRLEQAAAGYREAAQVGHPGAQLELARMRLYGIDAAADPDEAVQWLQRAQAAGHPAAGYLLAMVALGDPSLSDAGSGDTPAGGGGGDPDIAARVITQINQWMLTAMRHELAPALRAAAILFGRSADSDDQTRCLQLLERAAGRGDVVAAQLLAERLARGEGCPRQPQAAEDLWTQLARAGVPRLPAIEGVPVASPPADDASPGRATAAGVLDFAEALRLPASATLSATPAVRQFDGLLSADECRLLAASAQPLLHPSMTVDPVTGAAVANPLRTSQDAGFDPLHEDFALRLVQLRMARAAGLPLRNAEQLIVLRYAPGQEYRPHRDYLPPSTLAADHPEAGNRLRTICVYLNPVQAGGETEFPDTALKVAPQPGRAVVFDNLDGDGQPQPASLHAGCPVRAGEKWLATLWIRQRRYRTF